MPYLVTAVVFVGVLCCLDLLLTLGVIRRLRAHTMLLANSTGQGFDTDQSLLPAGEQVPDFTTSTVDGEPLTLGTLGETLIGFAVPGCAPCEEGLPDFIGLARDTARIGGRVVAVVVGSPAQAQSLVARLTEIAQVVVEGPDGPLVQALRVSVFPTYYSIDGTGTVRAGGHRTTQLPVPEHA